VATWMKTGSPFAWRSVPGYRNAAVQLPRARHDNDAKGRQAVPMPAWFHVAVIACCQVVRQSEPGHICLRWPDGRPGDELRCARPS
jgi:hypothetical protein